MCLHYSCSQYYTALIVFCSFRGLTLPQLRLRSRSSWRTTCSCCPREQLQTTTMSLSSSGTQTTRWSSYKNSCEREITSNFSQKIKWIIKYIDCQNALICLFLRDSVLLRSGSWSRKIEVAKSSKGQEISIHLISSEYGKPWKGTYFSHNTVIWYEQWTRYTLKGCFKTRILPLISFL